MPAAHIDGIGRGPAHFNDLSRIAVGGFQRLVAQLWTAAHHGGVAPAWLESESQTGVLSDAGATDVYTHGLAA
jgi:hypothetical protein